MTVYYSVGTLSPTFISWNDKNIYFGVESRIDEHKNIKGLPEWNPVVQIIYVILSQMRHP
jgi:hypothetical protein